MEDHSNICGHCMDTGTIDMGGYWVDCNHCSNSDSSSTSSGSGNVRENHFIVALAVLFWGSLISIILYSVL